MLGLALSLCVVALGGDGPDNPSVKALLESPGRRDDDLKQPFFAALAKLARDQGLEPEDYISYRSENAFSRIVEGRAVSVDRYVVAIVHAEDISLPGVEAQQLVLLDSRGRILDKIACGINSRYGTTKVEATDKAEDGARLVIRFVPHKYNKSSWHNWHTITRGGRDHTYREPESGKPNEWDREGLCRVAIKSGKFAVVYPDLEKAERR